MNYLYHFIAPLNFLSVLESGVFVCKYDDLSSFIYGHENGKFKFAISCTRNKNLKWQTVRLYLNYDLLKTKYKIKPVSHKNVPVGSQSEERIYTNDESFPILKYLEKVDFIRGSIHEDDLKEITSLLNSKNINYSILDKDQFYAYK